MKIEKERLKIGIILGLMCCFLTTGIITQIKTVKNSTTTVGKTQTENELRDSVLRWKEKYDNAYAKLDKKEKELEKLREQVSNSTDSAKGLSSKLERYNLLLGKSDLIGKGITITLKDAIDILGVEKESIKIYPLDGQNLETVPSIVGRGETYDGPNVFYLQYNIKFLSGRYELEFPYEGVTYRKEFEIK